MFVIEKNKKIILTKGDTASIYVQIVDLEGKEYVIQPEDVITMTVRKTPNSDVAIEKVATPDHYIVFSPSDTSSLSTGLYVYDVQIHVGGNFDNTYTIVPMSYFELRNEVTR